MTQQLTTEQQLAFHAANVTVFAQAAATAAWAEYAIEVAKGGQPDKAQAGAQAIYDKEAA